MPRRPDLDAAVDHLSSYTSREPWPARRREHLATMLGRIPALYGLDFESLFEEIHQIGHLSSMVGFVEEAFLSAEHGEERVNPIDDYLRRRGWQETPRAREYLLGIQSTPPSLYEVQDIGWGEWIEVRDRLRGGPTQRIGEHSASQTLQRWDCLVGRVVQPRGELMLTGGVLSLTLDTADRIEDLYRRVTKAGRTSVAALADELGVAPEKLGDAENAALRFVDRICFSVWLMALLDAARRPLPTLHNTDGDPLLFARARLPVAAGAADEIGRALDALAGWEREQAGEPRWTWARDPLDKMPTILGTARLERDALVVETNSSQRMEQALAALRVALGPLVGEALTSYEDPAHALSERGARTESKRDDRADTLPPEDTTAIAEALTRVKDAHYRRTLDEPVPMLGNRTPRQCARSKQGRTRLVRWLKQLENGELQQAARSGAAPYDMAWMWRELGVESEG